MNKQTPRNIGVILSLAGFILNPWILGALFLPQGKVETLASIRFILLAELYLVSGGIWFLARQRSLTGKTAWFSLVIIAVIPLGIEGGLHVVKFLQDQVRSQGLDMRLTFSCYRDKPWASDQFKEQRALVISFEQYLGWRTREYHGRYMNIEPDGTRRTINAIQGDHASVLTVFVFGGSTTWGAYVRDSCTIPSFLSLRSGRGGPSIHAVNFGEQGYNFTQGVVKLALLLRAGKRPDAVLFYEGFNDIDAAEVYGHAGETSLLSEMNGLIESRRAGFLGEIGFAAGELLTRESMLYKSVARITRILGGSTAGLEGRPDYNSGTIDTLSRAIAEEYRMSSALVDSLSSVYGFRYACVLQPSLFTKGTVNPEEMSADPRAHDAQLRSLFLLTYAKIREERLPHLSDFSHIFDSHAETVFIDACHVSEEGNAIVADSLLSIIRP
jgi:hypothetical protein